MYAFYTLRGKKVGHFLIIDLKDNLKAKVNDLYIYSLSGNYFYHTNIVVYLALICLMELVKTVHWSNTLCSFSVLNLGGSLTGFILHCNYCCRSFLFHFVFKMPLLAVNCARGIAVVDKELSVSQVENITGYYSIKWSYEKKARFWS